MRIDIIVVNVRRYERGHEKDFVPPLTGIHLAALTPPGHEVRVVHQQVEPIPWETDADLIALTFFSGFAAEAYRIAAGFRRRGKTVVAGGPHVTFAAEEALLHVDAVVVGEAESVWGALLADAERGRLEPVYRGRPLPLDGIPTPRYDLLPARFFVPRVIQATRGCPFTCSFCTVPTLQPGFRTRPVEEVLRDVAYDRFDHWWQRKVVWFWDDNLTANRAWVKRLLRGMIPLRRWWLTQASIDIVRDAELLDLMQASGCIGIFLGIESFEPLSLRDANKRQNRAAEYRHAVETLHRHGICVMAGFIAGFDHDTKETICAMPAALAGAGIDVPFLSVLTPFKGTPLHHTLAAAGRLLEDRGPEYLNGYNVAFRPATMTPEELHAVHRTMWRAAFSPGACLGRVWRGGATLRAGALLMSACMNGFYGLKRLTGNLPIDAARLVTPASRAASTSDVAATAA